MDSLIILLLAIHMVGISGATEECRKFDVSQNSLEIVCNSSTVNDCFSTEGKSMVEVQQLLHLRIKDCPLTTVQTTIKMASNLIIIDLSSSSYKTFDAFRFTQHQLQAINASHNNFTQMPLDFLLHTPNVIELDFSYNNLERIESTAFIGAPNLQRIHLSNNRISFLADDAFTNLTQLQYVNLNGNQCHWIDMFQNNKHLRHLLVADNPIFNFNCNHFLKMTSISVVISWKDIRYFHTNCLGNQFNVFLNTANHSESILPAQREIYCNEQSFRRIQQFSAGRSKFENVGKMLQCFGGSALREMDLSGNFVGIINRTVFKRFENLEWISLSDTILLDFDFDMFDAQRAKLERLDVSFNDLMNLHRPESIRNFIQLKQFIAAECRLRNALEIISNLPSTIKYLDLSGNLVGHISADIFQRLQHLQTLKLNSTALEWPKNTNPFERCENLRILDISQNPLANTVFSRLSATLNNLTDFSAANCQLQNAVHIIQYFSAELSHLDLSGNLLGQLNADTFQSLIHLKTLSLSNVGLTNFDPEIFRAQQHLRFLNISHNRLTQMTFQAMPQSLVKLDLEWNDLMVIWNFDRVHLPALESMSISKNRLQCSQLQELRRNWDGLKFSGDPMDQKYGNCGSDDKQRLNVSSDDSMIKADADGSDGFSTHLQYALVIVAPIIGIILTGCIGFTLYRQIERICEVSDGKMSFESTYDEHKVHKEPSPNDHCAADHIYEEIDDCIEYDRLRFDTDPMPLTMVGSHYQNVHIRTALNDFPLGMDCMEHTNTDNDMLHQAKVNK